MVIVIWILIIKTFLNFLNQNKTCTMTVVNKKYIKNHKSNVMIKNNEVIIMDTMLNVIILIMEHFYSIKKFL